MKSDVDLSNVSSDWIALLGRVQSAQYTSVASLDIAFWLTPEPVPFAQRKTGFRRNIQIGESWSDNVFDCAWFCFSARVPEEYLNSPLVVRIDVNGELCIVSESGVPLRGLTSVKSTFDPILGAPGKTVYRLPQQAIVGGKLELWADAGMNDLFGFVKDGGRIALAEVAVLREDIRQLYYDLESLHDFYLTQKGNTSVMRRLEKCLTKLTDTLDLDNPESITTARKLLAPLFQSEDKPALKVHAIGHAHLDLAWLWPIRETLRKGARTFASALYNSERYPHYRFGCSQPQLFDWMKSGYPELYGKIKQAVHAGKIEPIGTFWVEPDCSIPSGESFVRQILYGARFFKEEFGIVPDYCWQPDVFGYHGQLPQILKLSGHNYFMTQKLSWNVVNRFGHHSFFWEGVDGTRILTHMLPEETYNSPAAPRSLYKIGTEYAEKDVSNHALMVYGIGDGGGGPDAEHLERLLRAPGMPGLPEVKFGTVSEFFNVWSRDQDQFPTWSGELYLERHQGTLTTQAEIKRQNRRAEIALRELEWVCYLEGEWPRDMLDRLWKEVLLYQFHDVLPGTSIKRVYDECYARYHEILKELENAIQERYQAIALKRMSKSEYVLFNSLSWPRKEWVQLSDQWYYAEVPAFGYIGISGATGNSPDFRELTASNDLLENGNLSVRFNDAGYIVSMVDRRSGREHIANSAQANAFVVIEDTGNVWDFETDHDTKDVWGYLRRDIESPVLVDAHASLCGPHAELHQTWRFRTSTIEQTIRLSADSHLLEFNTKVDWREKASMLRVRFPVAVETDNALYEIPFGHIARSTREDTLLQCAQIEVAALQWVDLSQESHGVTVYNDCKYGYRIKQNIIDMALIRCVPYPGAPLINKEDVSGKEINEYTDMGHHHFRYALRPHSGPADTARNTAEARRFNTPLHIVHQPICADDNVTSRESVRCPIPLDTAIEVAAIKQTVQDDGWAIRLVNVSDRHVSLSINDYDWVEADLFEQPLMAEKRSSHELHFRPLEIKTLRTRSH